MQYRPDVDGLRAVAVMAVIGFHAFPDWVPGGFIGVDVFFVISGFLISGVIFSALESGRFTFTDFYARRIRRIFPALVVVLTACYAAGWLLLFADRYAELGKHIAGGAGFVANYVLWNEAGYFDRAADTKPLLHLWSLGVEEQFYLVWPLLVWLAWKRRVDLLVLTLVALAGSMYLNLDQIRRDLVGTFYSPFTRFWELMSGGVLAYVTVGGGTSALAARARALYARATARAMPCNVVAGAGAALVLGSALFIDQSRHFPGLWAAAPVVGAALIITAGADAWVNRLLSTRLVVGIGLISYPLYLWHWPLLSFLRLTAGETPPAPVRVAAMLTAFVLAGLTYWLVERPIRFGSWRRMMVAPLCISIVFVGVLGYHAFTSDGLLARPINRTDKAFFVRYYESFRKTGIQDAYRLECDFMEPGTDAVRDRIDPACTVRGTNRTWFLWGDSYAQALSAGIRSLLPAGTSLAQVATSHCRPSLAPVDLDVPGGRCGRANGYAMEKIRELRPKVLILAQREAHEQTDWEALAAAAREWGVEKVVLVGPVPMWDPSLPEVVTSRYWGSSYERVSYGLVRERFAQDERLARRFGSSAGLTYVSLIGRLCHADGCQATVPGTDPAELVAFDAGHLTPRGSSYVAAIALGPALAER